MNQKQTSESRPVQTLGTLLCRYIKPNADARCKSSTSLLRGSACAILAFLLGGCMLPFSVYPLGVAFLCAATDSLPFCIIGFLVAGFSQEIPLWLYPAACALILLCRALARIFIDMPGRLGEGVNLKTLSTHLRGRIFAESLYLRMTTSCVAVFFLSLVSIIGGGFRYYDLFGALFAIAIAPLAVFLYSGFFGTDGTTGDRVAKFLHHASGAAIIVSICLALTKTSILGNSLGVITAFVGILAVSKRSGFVTASITALACGVCLGVSYVPLLLSVSVTAYCLIGLSPVAAAAISCIVGSLTGYFLGNAQAPSSVFLPFVCGGILFCIGGKVASIYELSLTPVKKETPKAPVPIVTASVSSFDHLSDALFSLSESFFGLGRHLKKPSETELRKLCDEVFDEICPLCPNRSVCWEQKYTVMQETVTRLATTISKASTLDKTEIPAELTALCGLHENVIEQIRARVTELSRHRLSEEKAQIFALDYSAMSKILRETSQTQKEKDKQNTATEQAVHERLCVLGFEPLLVTVRGERGKRIELLLPAPAPDVKQTEYLLDQLQTCLGICLSPFRIVEQNGDILLQCSETARYSFRRGSSFAASEGVCGDAVATFEDAENGYFYTLLCDGMGTGVEAALTARLASTFLQKLLSAGVRPETALRMLSDFLRLGRNGGSEESTTTVDLLQLDKYTGKGVFFKCGAAPTYVKRGSSIFKLSASTVPLGIFKESSAKRIEFDFLDGDIAVMVSDGIGGEEECLWLLDYLSNTEETNPENIAKFLTEAASAHGSRDDLSALVLHCSSNT